MIVCTKTVDSMARRVFGRNDVAISSVDKIIETIGLDPAISQPKKDAFIIADSDIRNSKMLQKLQLAAATKHPDVRIIYVVRSNKSNIQEGKGIDKVLMRPRPETLEETVHSLVESIEEKAPVISSALDAPEPIPAWKPSEFESFGAPTATGVEEVKEEEVIVEEEPVELVTPEPVEEIIEEPVEPKESELVRQIKECSRVADVAVLTRELNSAKIIKDIVKDNQQYVMLEDRLKGLQEKMYSVFTDPTMRSMEEKLERVKALMYDKDYYKSKTNTLIEQRVEEVINTLTDKTRELLTERLGQLDKAIVNMSTRPGDYDYARLAGITEERANLILELSVLDKQIREIFMTADEVVDTLAGDIAEDHANVTGSPLLDAHLKLHGESIVSDKALDTIIHILSTHDKTEDEFKAALRDLSVMQKKLNKLIELDRESLAALTKVIELLRANNVEDTVIAETLLKKSMRIFVAKEGAGRTVVPYVLSKLKSRSNANVLYLDLTGTSKLSDYGETYYSLDEWMNNKYEKEFCAVAGEITGSPESVHKLMVALTRAADYYRVINIVLSPDQEEIIHTIAPEVKVINYLIDTSRGNFEFFKNFIDVTTYDNVAQRVIINKCDVQMRPIIENLGLIENMNVHVTKIPYIPAIIDCSLNKVVPSQVETVREGFLEVSKVC